MFLDIYLIFVTIWDLFFFNKIYIVLWWIWYVDLNDLELFISIIDIVVDKNIITLFRSLLWFDRFDWFVIRYFWLHWLHWLLLITIIILYIKPLIIVTQYRMVSIYNKLFSLQNHQWVIRLIKIFWSNWSLTYLRR